MTSQEVQARPPTTVTTPDRGAPGAEVGQGYRSARQIVFRQFVRNRGAIGGLIIVGFFIVLTLIGPLLTPYDPLDQDLSSAFLPASLAHPLGTDELGRDTLTRLL